LETTHACTHTLLLLLPSAGVENTPALKRVFKNYCKYALGQGRVYSNEGVPHMNAQQFHRLCQDAGFVEPEGASTHLDLCSHSLGRACVCTCKCSRTHA